MQTNDFYMFQGNLTKGWRNKQIVNVVPSVDTEHYIESATYDNVYDKEGKLLQAGVITIKGRSISNTTTVHMPILITDAWGLVFEHICTCTNYCRRRIISIDYHSIKKAVLSSRFFISRRLRLDCPVRAPPLSIAR